MKNPAFPHFFFWILLLAGYTGRNKISSKFYQDMVKGFNLNPNRVFITNKVYTGDK
jgi:hypothetical protein